MSQSGDTPKPGFVDGSPHQSDHQPHVGPVRANGGLDAFQRELAHFVDQTVHFERIIALAQAQKAEVLADAWNFVSSTAQTGRPNAATSGEKPTDLEQALLPHAKRLTAAQFDGKARKLREHIHPESIVVRRARCLADRKLLFFPDKDGMATLWLRAAGDASAPSITASPTLPSACRVRTNRARSTNFAPMSPSTSLPAA